MLGESKNASSLGTPVNAVALTPKETMRTFQYLIHAVVIIMAIYYMVSPDSTIWVAVMLMVTPTVTSALQELTDIYQSFHLYVVQRCFLLAVLAATIATWKITGDQSGLLVQITFLTVLAS
jgi:hypothetical protein